MWWVITRCNHFYPRTPCGVRPFLPPGSESGLSFLSTYPVRGTTYTTGIPAAGQTSFLSTYPVRGTTPAGSMLLEEHSISIHVPRAGYDRVTQRTFREENISIHVPRAGYDVLAAASAVTSSTFLSTYPVRGTTSAKPFSNPEKSFLSTYPVRGTTCER